MASPQIVYIPTLLPGTAIGQSAYITVGVTVAGFELHFVAFGVQPNTANLSSGWSVSCYRSSDGGTTYETIPSVSMSIARAVNTKSGKLVKLEAGWWQIVLLSGYEVASTWSFNIGTMELISAIA
jgi:hypothetical protein